MRLAKLAFAVAFLVCAVGLTGCKSEAEKQVSDVVDKQKEMLSILKGVTDNDSAKAANDKLKALAKDIQALVEKGRNTKASQDEQTRLKEKYKPELEQISSGVKTEMQRIAKIPGASFEMLDGMMEVGAAAMKASMPNGRLKP